MYYFNIIGNYLLLKMYRKLTKKEKDSILQIGNN